MPATVVCLSGLRWAGMHDVAQRTADALGFALVDEEIVLRAAAEAGIDPKVVAGVEARQSLLERMLGAIALSAEPTHLAYAPGSTTHADVPPSDALRDLIRAAIEETAARGQVVIVSHAASHALAARTDVLRVLVTATAEARRARLVEEDGRDAANPER
ncbi:MAG: cytidylate kinase family protein, partial [Gaiella sp.]